jgi:hypothetical protein
MIMTRAEKRKKRKEMKLEKRKQAKYKKWDDTIYEIDCSKLQ